MSMYSDMLQLAGQAIRRHLMRSMLAMLGIVIGVAAVVAIVIVGNGVTAKVTADLAKLGGNLLSVTPGQLGPGRASSDARSFSVRDVEAMRAQLRGASAIVPTAQKSVTVVNGADSRASSAIGSDNAFFVAQAWRLAEGREFLDSEVRSGRTACILGATVRSKLFAGVDAVGRNLRIGGVACEIIGVLGVKGQSSFGVDQDDIVVMPLRAYQRRLAGNADIGRLMVSVDDDGDTEKVRDDIVRLLRERRGILPGRDDDFSVLDMKEIAQTTTSTASLLTLLLSVVAAVSLLVGGIGVMNIMLVSVTERTREIGIRLAIGALERQVLAQFLIEAVLLSTFGGVIGVVLGASLGMLTALALQTPFVFDPRVALLAFLFSSAIGIAFGYVPARRAASLDPIHALRHE